MATGKPKWWWVWHINCDCAAYDWARTTRAYPKRCRGCGRPLGPMSYTFMAKVQTITSGGAIDAALAET